MWGAIFPGQGSQHPGMGKFLFDQFKMAKETFEEASDSLSIDFKKLCFDEAESVLALTENTQPCLLLVSTATQRVLTKEFGFNPKLGAGHSVGEYSALVAAEAIEFQAALRSVRIRGQAMQDAVPLGEGGMTAVLNLDLKQIQDLCTWAQLECQDSPVSPANINSPGQIVISGKKSLLDWISANFKPEIVNANTRVKFIPLKVSAPFHCEMMKPAEARMRQVLSEISFQKPRFPIVQNVTAECQSEPESLRQKLVEQVCAPVRWVECMEQLGQKGVTQAIEVGSGKVLSGLAKKICDDKMAVYNVNSLEEIRSLEQLFKGSERA